MKKLIIKPKVKKVIMICFLVFLFFSVLLSPFLFIHIRLIGESNISLDYGSKYSEPGYRASIFHKDITDKVKVEDNLSKKIGIYDVSYHYRFFIYDIKKIRKVTVSDLTGPKIDLKGDKELSLTVGTQYEEPGYEAIDKLDGNLTQSVKVNNNIDIQKLGEYQVTYEVSDKAGNVSREVRKVKVEKMKPTQMAIDNYSLSGWYDSSKLSQTNNARDAYFNQIVVVGDSNIKNMYLNGYLDGNNAWAIPCLNSETMHSTELYLYGYGSKMKLIDAVSKYKPKVMILNFGTFSTWLSEQVFVSNANSMIEEIKKQSPDTQIILSSIYPITKGKNINAFEQDIINKFNFLILELADKQKIKYLDVQEVLKDKDGYGKDAYFVADKFHLNPLGHSIVKEYIKTHVLEGI